MLRLGVRLCPHEKFVGISLLIPEIFNEIANNSIIHSRNRFYLLLINELHSVGDGLWIINYPLIKLFREYFGYFVLDKDLVVQVKEPGTNTKNSMSSGHREKTSGGESDRREDELTSPYLELLMFSKKSYKNLPLDKNQPIRWFEYGAYYRDYQKGCFGLKIHSTTRFFEPSTGKVWISKKPDGIKVKVCSQDELEPAKDIDGQIIHSGKSRCDYLVNPLCSHLSIKVRRKKMKESRQPVWEFQDVLQTRDVRNFVDGGSIDTPEKAKQIFEKYFGGV